MQASAPGALRREGEGVRRKGEGCAGEVRGYTYIHRVQPTESVSCSPHPFKNLDVSKLLLWDTGNLILCQAFKFLPQVDLH